MLELNISLDGSLAGSLTGWLVTAALVETLGAVAALTVTLGSSLVACRVVAFEKPLRLARASAGAPAARALLFELLAVPLTSGAGVLATVTRRYATGARA